MSERKCLVCGSSECKITENPGYKSIVNCKHGFKYIVFDEVFEQQDDILIKCSSLILEKLLQNRNEMLIFYYDKEKNEDLGINLYNLIINYPKNISQKIDRILLNLTNRHPIYGYMFRTDDLDDKLLFPETNQYLEYDGILNMLIDLKYLTRDNRDEYFIITSKAWERVESLQKSAQTTNTAFLAISFGSESETIIKSIRKAVTSCGYDFMIISEKEHNNQIVPEILYEISKSKFVVVDITHGNFGAYYEAGYAHGIGKEVIVCCNKGNFQSDDKEKHPHFDISQKNMVLWDDLLDLEERLVKRIQSTVEE